MFDVSGEFTESNGAPTREIKNEFENDTRRWPFRLFVAIRNIFFIFFFVQRQTAN